MLLKNFVKFGKNHNFQSRRFISKITKEKFELKSSYDVVIIGAGHNGLVSAAYLRKEGYSVCVLERRNIIGGAAVTEEIVDGFKFSRASYVCSLLKPFIINDLKLKENGLKFYMREPYNSYTPLKDSLWSESTAKSLLLSSDPNLSFQEIAKFSQNDAMAYSKYEEEMGKFVQAVNILLENRPPNVLGKKLFSLETFKSLKPMLKALKIIGKDAPEFHELLTAPASKILNKWFESEPLKATLATDALIGTMSGPSTPGTGYVLLHHIMGEIDGRGGAWAYPEGGMGSVSRAMGLSAAGLGVDIFTRKEVSKILYKTDDNGVTKAKGVLTVDGEEILAKKAVFSGATPHVTFNKLCYPDSLNEIFGPEFVKSINSINYTSPVTKINVAVRNLPNFVANPGPINVVQDHHKCTIHLNCETMEDLEKSYESCILKNEPSDKPMIEMVIPSSLDPTIAPPGAHVILLFTQYTPFSPSSGSWENEKNKETYANKVFDVIEEYAPGFKSSVIGKEVLTPFDLEKIFGLTGGNIFHGSMSLDQLFWLRPIPSKNCWFPETPMDGLYLCGSGAHPGGGVMGLPGYLAYKSFLNKSK